MHTALMIDSDLDPLTVFDASGGFFATTAPKQIPDSTSIILEHKSASERAAFIVRAVNSHEALVEILNECREYFDQRADADQPSGVVTPIPNEEMSLLIRVEKALAQAREE